MDPVDPDPQHWLDWHQPDLTFRHEIGIIFANCDALMIEVIKFFTKQIPVHIHQKNYKMLK